MIVARSKSELPSWSDQSVGFVPTMGALHEGHLSLIDKSKEIADRTIVSIFVNPTQFGPNEDFTKYPRPVEKDLEYCRSRNVDLVYLPTADEIYAIPDVHIDIGSIGTIWEGAARPGHFNGVATVVAILFQIIKPQFAIFGLKDYQQCQVIRKLVQSLHFNLELCFCDTIREPSGLALSSRNSYLGQEELITAPLLQQAMQDFSSSLSSILSPDQVQKLLRDSVTALNHQGFIVDYFDLVHAYTLLPEYTLNGPRRLITAAKLGSVRLIDNIPIDLNS